MRSRASQNALPPIEVMAVIDLLVSAMEMLSSGLTALQETEREPDLDSVLQQLAMGFERFLKVTLMEVTRNTSGPRPAWKEMKGLSHSSLAVLDVLVAEARKVTEYTERPACKADLEFLESEIGLRRLLRVLGDFGAGGRYNQIDGLLKGSLDPEGDPKTRWCAIETDLLLERPDFKTPPDQRDGSGLLRRDRSAPAAHGPRDREDVDAGSRGRGGWPVLQCDRNLPLSTGRGTGSCGGAVSGSASQRVERDRPNNCRKTKVNRCVRGVARLWRRDRFDRALPGQVSYSLPPFAPP